MRSVFWGILILAGLAPVALGARDEFDAYIAGQRKRLEDTGLAIETREQIALDLTATLHRAAEQAGTDEARLARWDQAAGWLDDFEARYPGHPQSAIFRAQAAIDRGAIGRLLAVQAEIEPGDARLRDRANAELDEAIRRLGSIDPASHPGLGDSLRYQEALALSERASLDPDGSQTRRERLSRALDRLDRIPVDREQTAASRLLRAKILTRLGALPEAETEVQSITDNATLPLPERVEALVALRVAQGRFDDATRAIDRLTPGDAPERDLLSLEIALGRRTAGGADQAAGTTDAFRLVRKLRDQGSPFARLALIRLGRAIDGTTGLRSTSDVNLLIEAKLRLGEVERAAALGRRAADQAESEGETEAAAELRYQTAAILVREGREAEGIPLLESIAASSGSGAIRARAGLLRAVLLGRSSNATTSGGYREALESVIERFPDADEAGEARWLLGQALREQGDLDAARSLWLEIPRQHPRWLDARLAVASAERDSIQYQVEDEGQAEAERQVRVARSELDRVEAELARDDPRRGDVILARTELDLVPEVGNPARALGTLDRLLSGPLDEDRRERARLMRVLAMAVAGQYVEAERGIQENRKRAASASLFVLAHQLDRAASRADSDLAARRLGTLLRLVSEELMAPERKPGTEDLAEAKLRRLRADFDRGDVAGARRGLSGWTDAAEVLPERTWPDLADLALKVGDPGRAAATQLRIVRHTRSGSSAWLRARYGQSVALSRLGRDDEARQILDGTSVLHPDLGGPALKARFESLRTRLDME